MFIDNKARYTGTADFECLETANYRIYWHGFVYSAGIPAGLMCITTLAAALNTTDLPKLAPALKGSYLLLVENKTSGDCFVFVDNSGLYHAFYSDTAISTSFLELAAYHRLRPTDLDPETIVEFLHYGFVGFDRTLFQNIRKLPPEHIAHISPLTGLSFIPKALPALGSAPSCSLEELLRDFTSCVSAERVSVDLTGGMDTRFLTILLHYFGLPFEVAVRGNDDDLDVTIARDVAAVLGKDLHVCRPVIGDLESHLPGTLDLCDGLFDVVQSYSALQLQYERASRGVTLMVCAGGGELFRDHFWLQDFPFYSSKRANLARFCSFRLLPTDPNHSYLAGRYREISRSYRQRFLRDLAPYEVAGNTQTYDRIIYRARYRELLGRYATNHTHVLRCSVPFMERDAVMYGYQLPRSARFFDLYFRNTATKCLPQAARIPTTRGYVSLSAEFFPLATDISRYCHDKLSRITRRVRQKYFHGQVRSCGKLDEPLVQPQIFQTLRRLPFVRLAVETLKEHGILNPQLKLEHMEDTYLATSLTLGLVMARLQESSIPSEDTGQLLHASARSVSRQNASSVPYYSDGHA